MRDHWTNGLGQVHHPPMGPSMGKTHPPGKENGRTTDDEQRQQAPGERDPFAPPPADTPDRPWQPRAPWPSAGGPGPSGPQGTGGGSGGSGGDGAEGRRLRRGRRGGPGGEPPTRAVLHSGTPVPPPHTWASSGRQGEPGGPFGPYQPNGPQPRFDPSDPVHRRARYALLSGMWGLFFGIFGFLYIALLLLGCSRSTGASAHCVGPPCDEVPLPRRGALGTAGTGSGGQGGQTPGAPGRSVYGPAGEQPSVVAPPPTGQRPVPLPPPGWGQPQPYRSTRPQVPAALGGL